MERTTDIKKLKKGAAFTWGEIVQIHEVGPYRIAEYHQWKRDGCTVLTGQVDHATVLFHAWIGDKDTSVSYESLDAALAGTIAYRHDGPNTQAGHYFIKGLNPA